MMAKKSIQFGNNPLFSGPSLKTRATSVSPYQEINIDEIETDPTQPRTHFDTEAIAELAASIKQYGVLSPILVRLNEDGKFMIIAGERRYRASKLIGKATIPAIVDNSSQESLKDVLSKQLIENLQRQDLNPLDRSIAIGKLRDGGELSVRDIATQLSLSKSFVQRSLEILDLPDDLMAALREGASESKILLLAQISDKDLRAELLAKLDELPRSEIQETVNKVRVKPVKASKVSHRGTLDERVRGDLESALRTKVSIQRSKSNPEHGKLFIEFYSDVELQELYKILSSRASS
jgi:ParB family transcriptional regulator, chromosome partitioning protein